MVCFPKNGGARLVSMCDVKWNYIQRDVMGYGCRMEKKTALGSSLQLAI